MAPYRQRMRQLHCVGWFSVDSAAGSTEPADRVETESEQASPTAAEHEVHAATNDHLLLADVDGDEQFRLLVDDALRAAIITQAADAYQGARGGGADAHDGPADPTGQSRSAVPINAREIQRRVRAGEEPQIVAENAELPIERVLMFAAPVLEERERIIGEARRARANRTGGGVVVFGEAVDRRFSAHGIDPNNVRWQARRQEDQPWEIAAFWRGGDADRVARWSFALSGRTVSPQDDTAADLLSDRPIRPVTPPAPHVRPQPPEITQGINSATIAPASSPPVSLVAPSSTVPSETTSAAAFAAAASAAQSPASQVETSDGTSSVGPDNGVRPDDDTGPLPELQRASDGNGSTAAAPRFEPGTQQLPAEPVSPPLPLPFSAQVPDRSAGSVLTAAAPNRRGARRSPPTIAGARFDEETEEQRASRARVPSWDDIMLGVRRKRD